MDGAAEEIEAATMTTNVEAIVKTQPSAELRERRPEPRGDSEPEGVAETGQKHTHAARKCLFLFPPPG